MTTAETANATGEVVELRPDDPPADVAETPGVPAAHVGAIQAGAVWSPADGGPRPGSPVSMTVPVTAVVTRATADWLRGPAAEDARARAAAAVRAAVAAAEHDPRVAEAAGRCDRLSGQLAEARRDAAAGEGSRLAARVGHLVELLASADGALAAAREAARRDALAALRAEHEARHQAAVRPIARALLNALPTVWESAFVIDLSST